MKKFALALFLALLPSLAGAGLYLRTRSVTGTATIDKQDTFVIVTATGGAKVATLPACPVLNPTRTGQTVWISSGSGSSSAVTVTAAGTDTIAGSATLSLAAAYDTACLTCNGSGRWLIQGGNTIAAVAATSATIGGGYGSTGVTISSAGAISADGAVLSASSGTFLSAAIGGGYGSTGTSISSAGVLETNGALTTDGNLIALSTDVGGGYGSSGCTISSAGAVQADASVTGGPAGGGVKLYGSGTSGIIETATSDPNGHLSIRSKGTGQIYFGSTTNGDPTGFIIFYPETSPTQSAIATNGTAGLKVSNTTASGPIDIGHPGSGADNARWGVRFVPDASGGPQLIPQGGPAVPADANLILSTHGTGAVKVRNEANNADAPLTASTITGTMFASSPQTLTVADSGGVGAATATLTPTASVVLVVCNDADGCDVTIGEGSAAAGQIVTIVNTSANVANFADSAGVSELTAAFNMGQNDTLSLLYAGSTWNELARANN